MEIILAKSAGFCFGVNRAIEACYKEIEKGGKIYTYGPLIHNKNVNADLAAKGVKSVDSLEGCEDGTVIIRSHGVGKAVYDELEARGIHYVDGTCPFVKKIHNIVHEKKEAGNDIIIIGDAKHPEVMGINGWCENSAWITDNTEDAEKNVIGMDKNKCYVVVVQTTFRESKYNDILSVIKNSLKNVEAFNTICSATEERQREAVKISQNVDKMLVIGDKGSSNTQKLFEICSIYSLIIMVMKVHLNFNIQKEWKTEECEKVVKTYCKQRFKDKKIKLPKEIETMLYLTIADGYKDDGNEDKRNSWTKKAYDNSNNSPEIQEIIKNNEDLNQLIDQIWEVIYQRFKEKDNSK